MFIVPVISMILLAAYGSANARLKYVSAFSTRPIRAQLSIFLDEAAVARSFQLAAHANRLFLCYKGADQGAVINPLGT